ncbi:probable NOT transcription complex subunit VIP2 isoform X10 [Vigna radiata var. radiata]|uniref:Probable NOT transcription complex subunit VIP2 isoform X10 n=1 Tax=Vigna radiata var. radiata TaxID=3916 RepID=A0A1S3TVC5_VIGRR|nr:probable NOT transcription complex subunit VIP2 isoform X10 [Vigna radiata var. radiata]
MSSLLNSSLNGSASNLPDGAAGRSFATSFSGQSGVASPVFHHSGSIQGLHNIHGSYNVPNMPSSLTSRNSTLNSLPTGGGVQQPSASLSSGRFASNNLPVALSQLSHGSSHGHSGVNSRGGISVIGNPGFNSSTNGVAGPIPGILPTSAAIGNRNAVPGLGVSPILGNAGPRITSSMGNMVGGGNIGRISSGGLSVPGLASRINLGGNAGSGGLGVQGQNRLISTVLPQGGNADFAMDMYQKEQLHDNTVSMMQSQHFSQMGRSSGFSLGGSYPSHRTQQHTPSVSSNGVSFSSVNSQDLHLHGTDMFPSSHSTYHSQTSGPPGIGLRPLNSPNTGMGSYDQLIQQYQQQQNQSQFRLQQMSAANQSLRDQGMKSMQSAQSSPDPFGALGLFSVVHISDPDLKYLAHGIDLTTLGLNLNSSENLYKTFRSPWSDEPAKGDPEFSVLQCYYAKQPPALHQGYFLKFSVETLFYIFYSMPKDEAQLYAANELYKRGWFYHKEHRFWFIRVANMEPLVKTNTYERGSYHCFDPNTFETVRKDNFVLHYELVEKRPSLPQR